MPTISVVIPAYNCADTIAETVNTVLAQSFADFELIVVESSSTDHTAEVLGTLQDSRMQVLSMPQGTAAVNRNRGAKAAQGEFISFLDSDDLWTATKLESQHRALMENPAAALVYSWTNCIDEEGKFLRRCSYVHWSGNVLDKLLLDDFIGSGSNVMLRQAAFWAVGGFDETLTNAEDTDLWMQIGLKYPFTVVPEAQILYRIRTTSKSSNIQRMERCNLRVIEKAYAAAPLKYHCLKPYSLANLYKYLLYRALEVDPGKQQTWLITRFIVQAIVLDRSLLKTKVIYKAMLKLLVLAALPNAVAARLTEQFQQAFNTSTFLGYEITTLDTSTLDTAASTGSAP